MRRLYVVCYDIADRRRLARVAKVMEGFGDRVQESVFECHMNEGGLRDMQHAVADILDAETDHVRYYPLCGKDVSAIQIDGVGPIPGISPTWSVI